MSRVRLLSGWKPNGGCQPTFKGIDDPKLRAYFSTDNQAVVVMRSRGHIRLPNLTKLFEVLWRVRRVSIDISVADATGRFFPIVFSCEVPLRCEGDSAIFVAGGVWSEVDFAGEPESESEAVCLADRPLVSLVGYDVENNEPAVRLRIGSEAIRVGKEYWLPVDFDAHGAVFEINFRRHGVTSYQPSQDFDTITDEAAIGTRHVFGIDGKLYPYVLPPLPEGDAGPDWSATLAVVPIEWWPFAQEDGSHPIWNSATGAQLRDPHFPEG